MGAKPDARKAGSANLFHSTLFRIRQLVLQPEPNSMQALRAPTVARVTDIASANAAHALPAGLARRARNASAAPLRRLLGRLPRALTAAPAMAAADTRGPARVIGVGQAPDCAHF